MQRLPLVAVVAVVATAYAPPVPATAQRAIAKRTTAVYAFVPARVPAGFHYVSWRFADSPPLLRIFFENEKKREQIIFATSDQPARCKVGSSRTFHVTGFDVYYTHTPVTQQAWRCVRSHGAIVRLIAATREPPAKVRPTLLATTAAAARRIR
jgi:hypothetical protein